MCFFCVLFVFGREEKCVEMIQAERKTQKSSSQNVFFFFFLRVPRAFYSLGTIFEVVALQGLPPSKGLGSG